VSLQIDPALRVGAEVGAKSKGRIHSDAAQTFDDFIDAPGRHIDRFGQRVLADEEDHVVVEKPMRVTLPICCGCLAGCGRVRINAF